MEGNEISSLKKIQTGFSFIKVVTSTFAVHRIHKLYDLLGPGGYPRVALSLPIYGLTANNCR